MQRVYYRRSWLKFLILARHATEVGVSKLGIFRGIAHLRSSEVLVVDRVKLTDEPVRVQA